MRGHTVSTASSVLPTFQPGFMPAVWAAADMALNFAFDGHLTAVTFPDGNARYSSAIHSSAYEARSYLAQWQKSPGAVLLQSPDQSRIEA